MKFWLKFILLLMLFLCASNILAYGVIWINLLLKPVTPFGKLWLTWGTYIIFSLIAIRGAWEFSSDKK